MFTNLSLILLGVSKSALKALTVALGLTQLVSQLVSLALHRLKPCT
jgi:hypothetical protein